VSADQLVKNPRTGKVVVAQAPNPPLWIFIVTTATRLAFHPHGGVGTAISIVGSVALAWWAIDEIVRGESPFRRILGGVVLVGMIVSLVLR
jgi:hypothetical protein